MATKIITGSKVGDDRRLSTEQHPRRSLRYYQSEVLRYTNLVQHPALFLEMRLGKTLITIRTVQLRKEYPVLVVCPYSAFDGWLDELELEGENSVVEFIGTPKQKYNQLIKALSTSIRWFIMSQEAHLHIPSIADLQWRSIVLDERFITNPRSKATTFFIEHFRTVDSRYLLTGTPAPESELEYFPQMQYLDTNIFFEDNYYKFRHKHFHLIKNEWGKSTHRYTVRESGRKYIADRLALSCFFLLRKEVNLGGEKIYEKVVVEFPPAIKKVYNTICREFVLEYQGKVSTTIFAGQKYQWLRQLCGGFVEGEFAFKGKYNELVDLLKHEFRDEQVIIWCDYTSEIQTLGEKLNREEMIPTGIIYGDIKHDTRREYKRWFNEGRLRVLVIQSSMSRGLKLSAASTTIYYSSPVGLEDRLQTEDRTVDVEDTDSLLIIDMMVKGTVDIDIAEGLRRKETQNQLLRRIVKSIQRSANEC